MFALVLKVATLAYRIEILAEFTLTAVELEEIPAEFVLTPTLLVEIPKELALMFRLALAIAYEFIIPVASVS